MCQPTRISLHFVCVYFGVVAAASSRHSQEEVTSKHLRLPPRGSLLAEGKCGSASNKGGKDLNNQSDEQSDSLINNVNRTNACLRLSRVTVACQKQEAKSSAN